MFDVVLFGSFAIGFCIFIIAKFGYEIVYLDGHPKHQEEKQKRKTFFKFDEDINDIFSHKTNSTFSSKDPTDPWENRLNPLYSWHVSNVYYDHSR